ncbi:CHAP domain-containing protein, partial [Cellulophaga sp. BC115SP]|uniref:CHAP domain-containing protein n=1 Tax=Cellulophaga sp. BC115SP TaxID=2683263 RepID=UPI001412E178
RRVKNIIKVDRLCIFLICTKNGKPTVPVDLNKLEATDGHIFLKDKTGKSNPMNIFGDDIDAIKSYIVDNDNTLDQALSKMEELAAKHIPYSQQGVRDANQAGADLAYDCSEFVGAYLMKLGISYTTNISTGIMTEEKMFRKAIGSENIKFMAESDEKGFEPQRGDIFVWRYGTNGHTGIVLSYDASKKSVTILESIGSSCSADENYNTTNGGDNVCGSTRKAVYKYTD